LTVLSALAARDARGTGELLAQGKTAKEINEEYKDCNKKLVALRAAQTEAETELKEMERENKPRDQKTGIRQKLREIGRGLKSLQYRMVLTSEESYALCPMKISRFHTAKAKEIMSKSQTKETGPFVQVDFSAPEERRQIGRASCRERVWS
jgi:translation elongation factor EF-1beta